MTDEPTMVKCLVWDLDNTLWKGTLLEGDDLRVADEVRRTVRTLDEHGVLQSVASRNEHDEAWGRLEEFGLAEYFVLPKIGWGRKSDSVRAIADELNFAYTTVAFVDDLPSERAEVELRLPDVRCYPADLAGSLASLPEFKPRAVTADSRRRRQMYQASFRRQADRDAFPGPDEEFLRTLDLVMTIGRAGEEDLARVEELTLRTSQMNATGVYYSDARLRDLIGDPGHAVLIVTMRDRFGPHGAVGVVLLEFHEPVWHLKLIATSCRVVSFGAGAVLLNWLAGEAHRAGVHLAADFRPTGRNRMMEIAYRFAGYGNDGCQCLESLAEELPDPEVDRLHLVPAPPPDPGTMTLVAPDLAGAR
ncbi:HAD family hydrolase [Actinomadura sp. WMMA1423]|uniref:HAD-IIIC family phosphatase n=1 Tax=Actinomadura sp. WMMA1423 TaxID=2591108 RepID=UPI00197A9D75|nr:HAD-IIIC family phosphatase [Actinomadura sp. WMMA1423]